MRVVLVGGGGHASDVLSVIEAINRRAGTPTITVVGVVADVEVDPGRFSRRGVRQIGSLADLPRLDASHYVIAIGYSQPRRAVYERIAGCGLDAAVLIHPLADTPPGLSAGAGTVIMANAHISETAGLGQHVCVSYGAMVGHDCVLEDFVTVLPGAAVSGGIRLEETSLVGTNATLVEGLKVGRASVVGAGAVVLSDVPPGRTVVGNPARTLDPS